jgi:glutathione S-transferase
MMKQVLGRYTEDELDEMLKHHPKRGRVDFLKKVFKAPYDAAAVDKSRRRLVRAFARMEETLARSPWLAGDGYSLADIAAAPVIDRVEHLGMADLWDKLPGMSDWAARLTARPAYRKARPKDEFRLPVAHAPG